MITGKKISRRKAIGGLGTGIAALAITPVWGSPIVSKEGDAVEGELQDPKKKYRSGRLTGRKALITGGDSGVGRAAAIAFAREGADVAINYYPTEEPDAREVIELIKAEGRKAVAIPGDLGQQCATWTERYPGQWGCSWPHLDAAPSERWGDAAETPAFGWPNAIGKTWPAGRVGWDLCAVGLQ